MGAGFGRFVGRVAGVLVAWTACRGQEVEPEFPPPPHTIMFLGTFHFSNPGRDDFKPRVDVDVTSDRRQRELEQVLGVLARYGPTRICVEAMPDRQAELDDEYARFVAGEFDLPSNETYQIGFRLARSLGHERVYAIDAKRRWYEPLREPPRLRTRARTGGAAHERLVRRVGGSD